MSREEVGLGWWWILEELDGLEGGEMSCDRGIGVWVEGSFI